MKLISFLTRPQIEDIHRGALRVLAEVGVRVDHEDLRKRLAALGGVCSSSDDTVRFPADAVERLIWNAPRETRDDETIKIGVGSGIYQSWYLDPDSDRLVSFDETTFARYIAMAKKLNGIESVGILGVPFVPDDIPVSLLPLAERLYAWKYGASPGGSVHFTQLCEPILEICKCHAAFTGKPLEEVFTAGGYMISPLRLCRPECEHLLYFAERNLRMYIGHLPSQGGTAPVTLAGSLVLALAEQIFLFLLRRSLWDDSNFVLESMVSTIDMRQGALCYGRPEQQRITLAFADIAAYYGCRVWGHTGLSDARIPSFEAGAQKATGALTTALATVHGFIEAGLLGTDEICSPVQMVLDCELASSLRSLLADVPVFDVDSAVHEIASAGIGGSHIGTDLTAVNFRDELFLPETWSSGLVSLWLESGKRTDTEIAREKVQDFDAQWSPASEISEEEERELRRIIASAK